MDKCPWCGATITVQEVRLPGRPDQVFTITECPWMECGWHARIGREITKIDYLELLKRDSDDS